MTLRSALGTLALLPALALVSQAGEPTPGVKLFHENKFAEAEKSLRAELAAHPDHPDAAAHLALALLRLNQGDEARAAAVKAVESAPDQAVTQLAAAEIAAEQNRPDDAASALAAAEKADDKHPRLPYVHGLLKVVKKDFRGAAEDLEAACQKEPGNAYAHYYAGLAYNQVKRPDRMISHFETFLKLAPTAPEAARVRSVMRTVR